MNSKIIELRETQSNPLNPVEFGALSVNGNYTVDIRGSNVCLQEGDTVNVKSAFLDTRTENQGMINIDGSNDIITIQHYLYMNDFRTNKDNTSVSYVAGQNPNRPDGKFYILNKRFDTTGANLRKIIQASAKGAHSFYGEQFGGFNQTYQYKNPAGQLVQTTFYYPSVNSMAPDHPTISFVANVGDVVYQATTGDISKDFKLVAGTTNYKHYFVDAPTFETEPASEGDQFVPVVFTTQFQIDQGQYTPDLLANTITDNIVKINQEDGADLNTPLPIVNLKGGGTEIFPSNNFFVTSTKQICNVERFGVFEGAPAAPPNSLHFVADDGASIMEIQALDGDQSYLVGASEVALEFDADEDKFLFKQLHTSLFNSGALPIVKYFLRSGNGGGFLCSSAGGIIIKDLEPASLWHDVMGFEPSTITTHPNAATQISTTDGQYTNVLTSSFNLEIGKNLTSDLRGMDASVLKNEDIAEGTPAQQGATTFINQKGSDIVRPVNEMAVSQVDGTATLGISSIKALKPFTQYKFGEGYFLLRINGLPTQDLHNMPNQSIQAIVSKYYSAGSYTIMEGAAGSFGYTHIGKPYYLHDLTVSILDPNGGYSEQIGTNNTVFIEITQNPKREIVY